MLSIYQSSIYHVHHHHLSNYCGKILSKGNLGIPIKSEVNGHLKPRYLVYEKKNDSDHQSHIGGMSVCFFILCANSKQ